MRYRELHEGAIRGLNRAKIAKEMAQCVLTGKYWDSYSVNRKPHLAIDWEAAHDMIVTWEKELPYYDDDETVEGIIASRAFVAKVKEWSLARYDEIISRLTALPSPGGHYRIHRTIRVNPHRLVSEPHTRLGVYWTYNRDGWDVFESPWASNEMVGKDIVIEADVVSSSIDWRTTVLANMDWMNGDRECEIRLFPSAPIVVLDILDLDTDLSLGLELSNTAFAA